MSGTSIEMDAAGIPPGCDDLPFRDPVVSLAQGARSTTGYWL
jgi:hypothetical protein